MNGKPTAAFVVSNEPYCPKAIMALLALRRHNPDYDCYVAGNITSKVNLALLHRYKIPLIHVDYSDVFKQPLHTWPSEIWWLPLIPRHLHEMGYDVCLGIDGDVHVVRPFSPDVVEALLTSNSHLAGIGNGALSRYITLDAWPSEFSEYICHAYGLSRQDIQTTQCTNSGVLWFNTKRLDQSSFYEVWTDSYKDVTRTWRQYSETQIFRADQQLFAILLPSIQFLYISPFYNYRFHDSFAKQEAGNDSAVLDRKLIAVHFVHSKPWYRYQEKDSARFPDDIGDGRPRISRILRWQVEAREIFGDDCEALGVLELDKTHWGVRRQWQSARAASESIDI